MFVIGFLQWWYGPGWRDAGQRVVEMARQTYLNFSVPILLRTLLAPWRRITSSSDGSLEQRARAMLDNVVSRAVGFGVRVIALVTALVMILLIGLGGGLLVLLWPILPPLSLILVAGGLVL
ncbi:MAG TPA: hypothetical protein VLI05_03945 [Candidatus Saccharimonadia bacterium]|nr:hypothetical protein [Candidatus Saccharimonadia bacterium]